MSAHFSADWLRLREAADHAARPATIHAALATWADQRSAVHVLDLATGIGSALRALAPALPINQAWLLVDQDPALLQQINASIRFQTRQCDLTDPRTWPSLADIDLVSMAALLDLVSLAWLEAWLDHQADRPLLAALTYDGRMEFSPSLPGDQRVRELINTHQRRNKGFGPALGPDAPKILSSSLTRRRYHWHMADSAWQLGDADRPLITALIDGWAQAAIEQAPDLASDITLWQRQRHQCTDHLLVGHQDIFATPP